MLSSGAAIAAQASKVWSLNIARIVARVIAITFRICVVSGVRSSEVVAWRIVEVAIGWSHAMAIGKGRGRAIGRMMAVVRGARSMYSVAETSIWRGMSVIVWPIQVVGTAPGLLLAIYTHIGSG